MRRPRLAAVVALGAATAVVLSGCVRGPQVGLAPYAADPACARPAWPDTVSGAEPVATNPDVPSVAAWGDPALIARCGVAALAPTTEDCVSVDGVDWVVRALSDGSAATTYGTDPAIEVLVPAEYGPAPLLLPAFAEAAGALPKNGRRCL